jgi:RHS repeat-associated protein
MTCWARKSLFVSPDTDYVLSGYFLSGNTGTGHAKAQIVYYDAGGGIIRIDDSGALGYSGDWKAFNLSSHAPADAATMEIRLTTEDTAGASVRFDGIRLKVPGLEGKYDFTGKRADEGTGLTYFGARFYDPESCRFVTADTYTNLPNDERVILGNQNISNLVQRNNSLELNRFIYTNDNPLGNIDDDGYDTRSFWGQVGKIIGSYISGSALSRAIQNILADKYDYTSKGLFVGQAYSFVRAGRLTTFLTDFFGSLFTGSAGSDAVLGAFAAQLGRLGNIGLLTFGLLLGVQQPCNTNEDDILYDIQVAKNFEQTIGRYSNSGPNCGFSNPNSGLASYDGRCSNTGGSNNNGDSPSTGQG